MNDDKVDAMIVRHIIGDIRVALSDEDLAEIESAELTDEELAEFDSLPDYEFAPGEAERMRANGMKIFRYILYSQEMKKRGLPHLDRHEFMNIEVEPTAPGAMP